MQTIPWGCRCHSSLAHKSGVQVSVLLGFGALFLFYDFLFINSISNPPITTLRLSCHAPSVLGHFWIVCPSDSKDQQPPSHPWEPVGWNLPSWSSKSALQCSSSDLHASDLLAGWNSGWNSSWNSLAPSSSLAEWSQSVAIHSFVEALWNCRFPILLWMFCLCCSKLSKFSHNQSVVSEDIRHEFVMSTTSLGENLRQSSHSKTRDPLSKSKNSQTSGFNWSLAKRFWNIFWKMLPVPCCSSNLRNSENRGINRQR